MDVLQQFYDGCHSVAVPQSLVLNTTRSRTWLGFAIPVAGILAGGILALLIVMLPSNPSSQIGDEMARALANSQMRSQPDVGGSDHARHLGARKWTA